MRSLIAVLIGLLLCPQALGQPTTQPVKYDLPRGTNVSNMRAFTLEEFKIVLHIYADYSKWFDILPEKEQIIQKQEKLVGNLTEQLKIRADEVKVLQSERQLLTKKWENENKARHLAENKTPFSTWIAWSIAAVMTAATAILTGVLIARESK